MSLAKIGASFSSLNANEIEKVRALFITLDPERDSPQRVQMYANYFHPNIIGLSGTSQDIEQVTSQFGIEFERKLVADSALGYTISHPSAIFLVDVHGTFVGKVIDSDGVGALSKNISELLASTK